MSLRPLLAALTLLGLLAACGPGTPPASEGTTTMNEIAEGYVRLVLAVGRHDADFVDAYYGPSEWRQEADQGEPRPLTELADTARALRDEVRRLPAPSEEVDQRRQSFFDLQLRAIETRIAMLAGERKSFDQESELLYDAVAPHHEEAHFAEILTQLEGRLPGAGSLTERFAAWRKAFEIPPEKLPAVFDAAIQECRRRTAQYLELPAGESFEVEYVSDQPWSAYNWYQGGFKSLIQVNTDLPITIDRAVDLACHEGYPGHHVYNLLLERDLVIARGWRELSVYPLFSPMSLIAEGTANFGIEVAFPGAERTAFERDVLYPLAGLDPERAGEFAEVAELVSGLSYAGNEAARRYLDGEIDAAGAADWLERFAMYDRPRAEQRVRFVDRYRSYVINYNLGRDLVRQFVESQGGTVEAPERRWEVFESLLNSPRTASALLPVASAHG
ncbi:MAG: hypothetical protein AAF604_00085 [Acidobacteriota bacterium]